MNIQTLDTEDLLEELSRRFSKKQKTIIDPETNLEWQIETAGKMSWHNAIEYAENLNLDGKTDWRIPTRKELYSIVSDEKNNPCCKIDELECDSSGYWSSTTGAYDSGSAWYAYFYLGNVGHSNKGNKYYVRCVRGGQ